MPLRWYGVAVAAAALATYLVLRRRALRQGLSLSDIEGLALTLLAFGVVGARLGEVLLYDPRYYLSHPWEVVALWHGGLSIFGGLIGGAAAGYVYLRRRGLNVARCADLVFGALPLGQAIGRLGNYFNQELYGLPTDAPWGIYIEPQRRLPQYAREAIFHPAFLYEALLNIALFMALATAGRRSRPGTVASLYLVGYGLIRFSVELWRVDPVAEWLNLRLSQWLALGAVGLGLALYARLRHRPAPQA